MLVSRPELHRDPGPMMSSTPSKTYTIVSTPGTSSPITNGIRHSSESPMNMLLTTPSTNTPQSHSCPNSPALAARQNLSSSSPTSSEPEVHSSHTTYTVPKLNNDLVVSRSPVIEEQRENSPVSVKQASCSIHSSPATTPLELDTESVHEYQTIKHASLSSKSDGLKQRLLSALADLIPHRESLSLRLLINYTIDDSNSECIVIDETLCRQSPDQRFGRKRKTSGSVEEHLSNLSVSQGVECITDQDSGCIADMQCDSFVGDMPVSSLPRNGMLKNNGAIVGLGEKRSRYDFHNHNKGSCGNRKVNIFENRRRPGETQVLDLSVHTDREDEMELGRVTNGTSSKLAPFSDHRKQSALTNESHFLIKNSPSNPLLPLGSMPISYPLSNGPSALTTTTANGFPFIDNPVLALLPLLQQTPLSSMQQPLSNSNKLFGLTKLPSNNEPLTSVNGLESTDSAESMLMKELQTLIQAANATNRVNHHVNGEGTNGSAMTTVNFLEHNQIPNLTTHPTTTTNNIPLFNTPFLNTNANNATSLVGLPMLNAFNPEQMIALLQSAQIMNPGVMTTASGEIGASGNNINYTLASSTTNTSPATTNNGVTSFNLGSATLLNLRDKQTGLETLGIMPTVTAHNTSTGIPSKPFPQPMTNLLNQLTSLPTPTSPLSLRNFSQLFQPTPSSMSSTKTTMRNHNGMSNNLASSIFVSQTGLMSTTLPTFVNGTAHTMTTDSVTSNSLPGGLFLPENDAKLSLRLSNSSNIGLHRKPMITNSSSPLLTDPFTGELRYIGALGTGSMTAPDRSGLNATDVNSTDGLSGMPNSTSGTLSPLMFGRRLAHTRRFTCNQCRKHFASLAELNRHTLEAHNSFKCTICSAHFTQRSNLQRHSLKHVGFKPFTCNLCKKEYYRKDHLVRHIEVTHPNHDPKMNITVHLTSSECLDYLDRIQAGKQTPSPRNGVDAIDDPVCLTENQVEEFDLDHKIEEAAIDESADIQEPQKEGSPITFGVLTEVDEYKEEPTKTEDTDEIALPESLGQ